MKLKKQELDNLLKSSIEAHRLPGLALGVVCGGEAQYLAAFGVRNINTQKSLKSSNIFHLASVSKPFVATAILQLVEQGKLSLDQTVTSILPYFKMKDQRYQKITLFQVLNHTSGMPDETDYEWDKPQYDEGAAERYVQSQSSKELLFDPGQKFEYSNIAFDVLGDVISKISGISFEDYMKQNILEPLQMIKSSFLLEDIDKELLVSPHEWDEQAKVSKHYPYNRRHAPSSTLNSNVLDMSNWLIANLNHGEWKSRKILHHESHSLLWKPSVTIDSKRKIGLSWFLETYKGTQLVSHNGWDTGFRSHLALLPEKNMGFILMCNCNYDSVPKELDTVDIIAADILNIILCGS